MAELRTVKVGMIGLGQRTETLLASIFHMENIDVTAICDVRQERIDKINSIFDSHSSPRPKAYLDYHELLDDPNVEALFVPTSWNSHLQIACDCMKKGKYVGIEVGGASSTEELWQLVHASESTGVSCMMLENCCYGRNELMVLNMVRKGMFGELIYCECGYEHDLGEMSWAAETGLRLERTLHNRYRNGDLYPTHGIGPIAKILNINRGNRFLTLSSHATKARGFVSAYESHTGKPCPIRYNEGDIVTTVIHCANGENITLTHGVSLPRPYSRDCRVQGTKGIWLENANGIYVDGISPKYEKIDAAGNPYLVHDWDKVESFYEKYDHPIWEHFRENPVGEHGGMDFLCLNAFLDAVRRKDVTPIDVYDCAAWMSITCLSEQSIALGGMPVPFPDFTNGKWLDRVPETPSKWALSDVFPVTE
ncbi:MAG: Gfo/Idh/MocA family oxidoreductase [Lentisphaeria bacterium]|nr:Gfo/Idh/MocA family oxidoreductase [Lentisphaeria bacterium]